MFETAGVRLTLIGQATPRHAAHFRRRLRIALPIFADATRESYMAAGAKIGGAMVIVPDGTVAWSQMAHDASDNVPPERLLAAVPARYAQGADPSSAWPAPTPRASG